MSDGLSVTAVAFRPPETNQEARLPPANQINDESVNDLAEAVFVSPVAQLDVDTSLVLFQFRDSSTGDVTRQLPSDQQISSYQNGTALSPTDLANFVANLPEAQSTPAAQQNVAAVEELQSGPELSGITSPDDAVAPTSTELSTDGTTTEAIATDTGGITPSIATAGLDTPEVSTTETAPPPPEPVAVSSGQPANGVSDVTNTGTDANANADDNEVVTLASS
ncbi:MAG: hypothetical protein AAF213_06050 [Pseudomonadota bacterium]